MNRVFIIAEAGVNHNGDVNIAKRLIDVASDAGADAVKFQTFKAEKLVTKEAAKAEYQLETTQQSESQYEMLKRLELDEETHRILIEHCQLREIEFLSTPFDLPSAEILNNLKISTFKIPSGELTNLPLIRKVVSFGKPIILSTGMATMEEIRKTVEVILESEIQKEDLTVLHCNTEYPTPMKDVNLRAMNSITDELRVEIGYSDHTLGIEVPIAAVAMGAKVIEKHFTLDRSMEGPDHAASLMPEELKKMVEGIRNIEQALGSEIKQPSESELKNMEVARKSIFYTKDLEREHIVGESDLIAKRPGNGISPMMWDTYIGKKLKNSVVEGDYLSDSHF